MVYRVLGIVNKTPFEGVELAYIEFTVSGQTWTYERKASAFYAYSAVWKTSLAQAATFSAVDYLQLHGSYGALLGGFVKQFIEEQQLDYKIQLIGSPGCNVFFQHDKKIIYALGDGAAIASITGINVVSNYLQMDAALGGSSTANITFEKLISLTNELFADAVAAAFFAILRWREENNLFAAETGATRDSIGGCVWVGQDW